MLAAAAAKCDNEQHHASLRRRPFACKSLFILTSRSDRIIHNFKIARTIPAAILLRRARLLYSTTSDNRGNSAPGFTISGRIDHLGVEFRKRFRRGLGVKSTTVVAANVR